MTKAQLEAQIARMEEELKKLRHQREAEQKAHEEEIRILKVIHFL